MRAVIRVGVCLAPLVVLGGLCGGCLDLLGHQEDVIQNSDVLGMMQIEDDRIEDKHPVFDPARTVTETFASTYAGCMITMNKSAAVTKLDIVPFENADESLEGKLFRGRTEALAAIASIDGADPIPSMEVVNGALKPFNDGLYAAVEMEIETSKRQLFATLATRLTAAAAAADPASRPAFDDAGVLVGAAQILAGDTPTVDAAVASRAQSRAAAFQAQPYSPARSVSTPGPGAPADLHRGSVPPEPRRRRIAGRARRDRLAARAGSDPPRRLPARRRALRRPHQPVRELPDRRARPLCPERRRPREPGGDRERLQHRQPRARALRLRAGRVPSRLAQQGGRLFREALLRRRPRRDELPERADRRHPVGRGRPDARHGLRLVRLSGLRPRDAAPARAGCREPEPAAHRRLQEEADRDLQVDPDPDPRDARQAARLRSAEQPAGRRHRLSTATRSTPRSRSRPSTCGPPAPTASCGRFSRRRSARPSSPARTAWSSPAVADRIRSPPSSICASPCSMAWRSSRPTPSG